MSDGQEISMVDDNSLMAQERSARSIAEVQSAMLLAKQFPRDETKATTRIARACARKALAKVAHYQYPKGGKTVSGPSIRLAEVLAQNWGNIETGVVELDRYNGMSKMMAYCIDLETNFRETRVWTVEHQRKSSNQIIKLSIDHDHNIDS